MEDNKLNTIEQEIPKVLKKAKRRSISYIIIAFAVISPWIIVSRLNDWLATREGGELMLIVFLLGLIIFISWQIRYHVFTLKIYRILLKSGATDLPIENIPIWWWFVPFMNLYKPYQVLKDVYNYANLRVWSKDKHLLDVRRISIFSSFLLSFEGGRNFEAIIELFIINVILNIFIYFISSSFIIFRLRKLYKLYQENQKEN